MLGRGESSGRDDDNAEVFVTRYRNYMKQTQPIVDMYGAKGMVRRVDAARDVDAVFADVQSVLAGV